MKTDDTEAVRGNKNKNQITSSDLDAQLILGEVYTVLKKKDESNQLLDSERSILTSIENKYLGGAKNTQDLSTDADNVLGELKEKTHAKFFQEFEKSLTAILRLDFSVKSPVDDSKEELLSYFSLAFNMIAEKLEASVISRKTVNAFFTDCSNAMVIVTNNQGGIRFMNDAAEHAFMLDFRDVIGHSIKDLIEEYDESVHSLQESEMPASVKVTLSQAHLREQSYYLSLPAADSHQSEIDELVHVLRKTSVTPAPESFDLALDSSDQVVPLNLIIGSVESLRESLANTEVDMEYLDVIYDTAWFLKEKLQGRIDALLQGLPIETEPIDFELVLQETVLKLSNDLKEHKVNIDFNVPAGLNFLSSKSIISSLLECIISDILKRQGSSAHTELLVNIVDRQSKGVSLRFSRLGLAMNEKQEVRESFIHANDMKIASQLIKRLNGEILFGSDNEVEEMVKLDLPHLSQRVY
ncbi:MAG: PAS domain-containing protein [Ekhidna sp.]